MARWRRFGGVLAVVALGAGLLTGCTRELGPLASGVVHADGNVSGTIVVCVSGVGGGSGFQADPGRTERIPLALPDGRPVCPAAINELGDIAGTVGYAPRQAVVRRHGQWKELPAALPPGSSRAPDAAALDINDAGRVVGVGPTDDIYGDRALVWDADSGALRVPERDGIPVGADGGALVDEAGRIVAYGASGVTICDTPTSCRPSLAGVGTTTSAGINRTGTFVLGLDLRSARGDLYMATSRGDASGLATHVMLPGWYGFAAADIGEDGTMVGVGRRTEDSRRRALRVGPDGTVTELAPDAVESTARAIDGTGRVLGTISDGITTQLVEWS